MSAAPLPPGVRAVMVFDATCLLCSATVSWVIRNDPERRIAFASAQGEAGQLYYRTAGHAPGVMATFLLVTPERVLERSEAGLALLRLLGKHRWLSAVGKAVPRAARDAVYDLVARNRYRWFGRRETCMVPEQEDWARFL